MRRAVNKFLNTNKKKAVFTLQLTAMVDMFTILIVFLLKSYSTSAIILTPQEGLKLPQSTSYTAAIEAIKLVVATDGIYVGEEKIIEMTNGRIGRASLDRTDSDFITPLFAELDKQAQEIQEKAKDNDKLKFEGKVVMQADERLNYDVIRKVMYTASLAGYADMKLATVLIE